MLPQCSPPGSVTKFGPAWGIVSNEWQSDRREEKKRVEGEKNEREVVAEKRSCAVRNGTVDRYGVIQIGCDRRNPRFAIINSHLARSSPAYDSRSMAANARGGFIRFYAEPRSARVAVGNDDIAWNLGSSWICLSRRMAED